MKLKHVLFVVLLGVVLGGCSKYQKLLKSQDYELWYTEANKYYEEEDYTRAATLYAELINIFRGTDKIEDVNYKYASCLYGLQDYQIAAHYYSDFVKNFPSNDKTEECQFLVGQCYYELSPSPRLDQTETEKALQEFQMFLNMYPDSPKVGQATKLMDELRDKLVYKSYLNAKLYYDLGDYLGNNYQSAVIAAENSLNDFPDTKYREELSFLILESKFIQAEKSVEEKKEQRARDTVDEFYSFINEFPDGKYTQKAEKILKAAEDMVRVEKEVVENK